MSETRWQPLSGDVLAALFGEGWTTDASAYVASSYALFLRTLNSRDDEWIQGNLRTLRKLQQAAKRARKAVEALTLPASAALRTSSVPHMHRPWSDWVFGFDLIAWEATVFLIIIRHNCVRSGRSAELSMWQLAGSLRRTFPDAPPSAIRAALEYMSERAGIHRDTALYAYGSAPTRQFGELTLPDPPTPPKRAHATDGKVAALDVPLAVRSALEEVVAARVEERQYLTTDYLRSSDMDRLETVADAIYRVTELLNEATGISHRFGDHAWGAMEFDSREWRRDAHLVAFSCDEVAFTVSAHPPHRTADAHRYDWLRDVGRICRDAGLPVRPSRKGPFAAILAAVLQDAGEPIPKDPYRLTALCASQCKKPV
jgi:hypothetical protein